MPPSTCCVHALPGSEKAPSEEALREVCRVHQLGLSHGACRCAHNVRPAMESAYRGRGLAVELKSESAAPEAERRAVESVCGTLEGTIQDLTSRAIVDALAAVAPGSWQLRHSGSEVPCTCRKLRDALALPPLGATAVELQARLLPPTKDPEEGGRQARLRDRLSKVQETRDGVRGTPEGDHAQRQLKRIRRLMTEAEAAA